MTPNIKYQRPTCAEIDISALIHNLNEAKRLSGSDRKILAVVKADAYGHGAVKIAKVFVRNGIRHLGVALVEEGIELREAGIKASIVALGGLFENQIPEIIKYNLTPVVYQRGFLHGLAKAARRKKMQADIHIKIDTGMGRVGLLPSEAKGFVKEAAALPNVKIEGIMTHFADADLADKGYAGRQLSEFTKIVDELKKDGITIPYQHIANSAALISFKTNLFNMVRPGIMLYGYAPFLNPPISPDNPPISPFIKGGQKGDLEKAGEGGLFTKGGIKEGLNLIPVMSLKTRIMHLKKVPAGACISYGRTFTTNRESIIATLPIGYADGYSRRLSSKGSVIVRGKIAPVVGRVCMDMTMIDVTDVEGAAINDEVVLIGRQGNNTITADDIARLTDTISYEVLCCIGKRVPRVYVTV
ncbi:MAG: alanine racemase [Nitrospirae bacterium]|nr:alanine racemase [Nitrospirota bacterium]